MGEAECFAQKRGRMSAPWEDTMQGNGRGLHLAVPSWAAYSRIGNKHSKIIASSTAD